jgi:hypothetical protein
MSEVVAKIVAKKRGQIFMKLVDNVTSHSALSLMAAIRWKLT